MKLNISGAPKEDPLKTD